MPVTGMSGFILFSHMRQKGPGGVNGVQKETRAVSMEEELKGDERQRGNKREVER